MPSFTGSFERARSQRRHLLRGIFHANGHERDSPFLVAFREKALGGECASVGIERRDDPLVVLPHHREHAAGLRAVAPSSPVLECGTTIGRVILASSMRRPTPRGVLTACTALSPLRFASLGFDVRLFVRTDLAQLPLTVETIVVGRVGTVHEALLRLGCTPPPAPGIPAPLIPYLGDVYGVRWATYA
jgi:hypothetical protein